MFFPNAGVEVNPALLLLLGLMVGISGAFFGVGAGFLITGGLLVFGVPPLFEVGTGLTLIMGSSLINTLKHRKRGNVDYRLAIVMIFGAVPGLVLAERLNSLLESLGASGPVIRYVYVILLATVGSFILHEYSRRPKLSGFQEDLATTAGLARRVHYLRIPPDFIKLPGHISLPTHISFPTSGIQHISVWVPIGIGFVVGFLAGLLGAGGGFILVPAMDFVLGMPATVAVGTGLFLIIAIGFVGTLLYSLSNNVDLLMAVIMLATASIGSQLGVAATRFVEGARIMFLFGITILSASVGVALKEAAESSGTDLLATLGSILLLTVSGAMCVLIAVMLVGAKYRWRGLARPRER